MLLVFLSILIGSLYGIVHDQLSYTISPEYYTKFKFYQFGLIQTPHTNPRQLAIVAGIIATWWMGLLIGVILALVALSFKEWNTMFTVVLKAMMLTMVIAFLTGLSGLAYGYLFLAGQPKENFHHWFIPDNITNLKSFIMVGSMHNFSYAGGLIGLLAGMAYIIRQKRKRISLPEHTHVVMK